MSCLPWQPETKNRYFSSFTKMPKKGCKINEKSVIMGKICERVIHVCYSRVNPHFARMQCYMVKKYLNCLIFWSNNYKILLYLNTWYQNNFKAKTFLINTKNITSTKIHYLNTNSVGFRPMDMFICSYQTPMLVFCITCCVCMWFSKSFDIDCYFYVAVYDA